MKKIFQWIGIGALLFVVYCGVATYLAFDRAGALRPSVEEFVREFDVSMNAGKHREVYEVMLSENYQQADDFDQFEKFAQGISEKLGKVTQRTERSWQVFPWRVSPDEDLFAVEYETVREKGKTFENFRLKRDGITWKIDGFRISSQNL